MTGRQRVFVEEYLQCWNATEAARRAGYANPNVHGSRLLANDSISEQIQQRIAEKAMSADEVLLELAEQARADIGDFLTFSDGMKLPVIDLAKAQDKTRLIKKLKYKDGQVEFELYDKQAALVHLGKHHGLFTDKIEHSGSIESKLVILPAKEDEQ